MSSGNRRPAPASSPPGDVGAKSPHPPAAGPSPSPPPLVAPGGRRWLSRATPVKGAAGPSASRLSCAGPGAGPSHRRPGATLRGRWRDGGRRSGGPVVLGRGAGAPAGGGAGLIWARLGPIWVSRATGPSPLLRRRGFVLVAWRLVGRPNHARPSPSSLGYVVAGVLASAPRCTLPAWHDYLSPSLPCCGSPAVVADVLLLVDKLPASVACWLLAIARLSFAGGRSHARVKTLLGIVDAEHGDTCGCHFLLGGVFLGRTAPPFVPGKTLGLLCQTGQRRHFGVVPFLKALCWVRRLRGSWRWWPRRLLRGLVVLCQLLL
jgi:hypothetical protein